MSLECPKCQSGDVQSLSVVYQSGYSSGTGTTTVNVPGAIPVDATQTITVQTELSRRASPPLPKGWFGPMLFAFLSGAYGLYSIPAIQMWVVLHLAERVLEVGEVPPNLNYMAAGIVPDTAGVLALGICGISVFLMLRASTYNRTIYPPLIERWRRSFLCRRCGEIFATA